MVWFCLTNWNGNSNGKATSNVKKKLYPPHLPENRTDASSIVLWPPPTTGQHLIGCYSLNTDRCPFLFFGLCPFLFFVWFFRSLVLPRVQQGCLLHRCVWEGRLVWERNWMVKISGVFQRSLFLGIIWHTFLLAAIFNLVDVVWYTANLILLENSTGSPKWTRAMSFCKREASYLNKMHCWIQIT